MQMRGVARDSRTEAEEAIMPTRLFAIAALALGLAATAHAQETGAGRPRADNGSTSNSARPPAPASTPTTGSTSLLPGTGIIVAPDDGGRPPRPEASPGTPGNPSGLKKPD